MIACILASILACSPSPQDTVKTAVADSLVIRRDTIVVRHDDPRSVADRLRESREAAERPATPPAPPVRETEVVGSLSDEPVKPVTITHLLFKGIPIDGNPAAFRKKLEKEGFRSVSESFNSGTFAGVDNVAVRPVAASGTVWKVEVIFPPKGNWTAVREEYQKFKNWFQFKYVTQPALVRERLSAKFREGSGQEAWGFENGESVYRTVFDFPEGQAVLYIAFDSGSSKMRVCIDYIDRVNSIVKDEHDMQDL